MLFTPILTSTASIQLNQNHYDVPDNVGQQKGFFEGVCVARCGVQRPLLCGGQVCWVHEVTRETKL